MLAEGEALPGELIKIPSLRDVDVLFGEGSVITEGLRAGYACCPQQVMEFYALPHLDADVSALTKAAYTITFTGDATSDGVIDLFIADGRYNTTTRITEGMTPTDCAANVVFELHATPGLPFDVTSALGVVTLTAKNAGTVGNGMMPIYNWTQRRNHAPAGVEAVIAQTTQGTNGAVDTFTAPDYAAILGECCYCCIAMLYDNYEWQKAMIAYIADAWSCDHPQCFGHGYTYNYGSLGQILANDTNSAEVSRLAVCTTDPVVGWLKAAAYAHWSCWSHDRPIPEMNVRRLNLVILMIPSNLEACFQCFTFDEQQLLQEAGFVVSVPLQGGTGSMTSPMIVNDVTNNRYDEQGRFNATWWAVSSRRSCCCNC